MNEETKKAAKAQAAKYLEAEEGHFTRAAKLHLLNVEPLYRDCLAMAREALEKGGKYPVDWMERELKEYLEDLAAPDEPGRNDPAALFKLDLLGWALQEVDRYYLAALFVDAVADED